MAYVISSKENPQNHLVYVVEDNMGNCILALLDDYETPVVKERQITGKEDNQNDVWDLFFYGAFSKEGAGSGVILIFPRKETLPISMKLEFDTTNNVAEYEALILGL